MRMTTAMMDDNGNGMMVTMMIMAMTRMTAAMSKNSC